MKKISAVIVAHNEEKKIKDCLKSLDFTDEIVIVLDKCSDNTKNIALEYRAKIIEGSWKIEGARRNVALRNASFEWVLEIDADERISKELRDEILSKIQNSKPCGFYIPIANYVGKKFIKYGWLRTLCVEKRQSLTYKNLKIYDEDKEVHPTFSLNSKIESLENPIIHLVDDNIFDLIARFNRYTNWRANDLIKKNKKPKNLFKLMIDFKLRFIKSFFLKKGYKEGLFGFLIAILCGLYPLVSNLKAKEKLSDENS
jgi:glycosyltransferase involved in cell wall biosynthesis